MAISARDEGTWAVVTADAAVTIPGGATTGDRMYLWAAWKDFSVTATASSAQGSWTEVTEFADGAVASGNGTGSMKVACWYRDHSGTEGNPTIDFSAGVIGAAVIVVFQKGGSETWDAPTFVTAAWPSQSSGTTTSSSSATVPSAGLVLALMGIRDDSATLINALIQSASITWGSVEAAYPNTHVSTTTGNDMSAMAVYRLVTTGATATLTAGATISANETGSVLWVVQGVTAAAAERVPFYRPMTQLLAH